MYVSKASLVQSFSKMFNGGFTIVTFNGTHPKMKMHEVKYHHTKFGAFTTK